MHAQAETVADPEGRALLHWLADGAMTLLGYEVERPGEPPSDGLGIMRLSDDPTDEGGSEGAIRYFEQGGPEPLIAKADLRSPVHRRVPLDLDRRAAPREGQDHRHRRPCRPVDQPGADRADRGGAAAPPPARRAREGVRLRAERP